MSIRIIGGTARGRFITTLKDDDLSVRPILARIKKSLFDILAPKIADCVFLDLFAGTGAVGLEALSRGCNKAVFVEGTSRMEEVIKKNIELLGFSGRGEVHRADITKGFGWLTERFDVIFMGPPYKAGKHKPLFLSTPTLRAVKEANLLLPGGLVICQHHEKEPALAPEGFEWFRQEKYGDTVISFFREKQMEGQRDG